MKRSIAYHSLLGKGNPLLRYPNLYEAAVNEFAEKRYEQASLNDILKNAGMSKGSFYHHFGDKFGLYLSMIDIIAQKKLAHFYPLLSQKNSAGFFDRLKEIMKGTMGFMLSDRRLHRIFNNIMEEGEDFRQKLYGFFPAGYFQAFYDHIRAAIKSGEIATPYPPELVVNIIEIIFSNLHKLIPDGNPENLINTANQVVDIIRHGIEGQ